MPARPLGLLAVIAGAEADLRPYGVRHPSEAIQVGRFLLVGQCLGDPDTIADAAGRADLHALTSLPGAYSWILADGDELTVFTDLAGQFPLYLSRHGDELALASHPGVLADRHGSGIDPISLVARIACPSVLPLWEDRSPYLGVTRLPGGRLLRVNRRSVHTGPASPAGPPAGLRSALAGAVAARCAGGPVSADFSGGLDSTSLAFAAARHTRVRGILYHHPEIPAGDLAAATALARRGIELTTVRGGPATLPYADLDCPPGGEPMRGDLAWRRSLQRIRAAESVHLTGEGGDALFGVAPSFLSGLVREPRRLMRHCAGQAELRQTSAFGLALRAWRLSRTSPAQALKRLGRRLLHPDAEDLTWPGAVAWWPIDGTVLSWLTRGARAELAARVADPALAERVDPDAGPAYTAMLTELRHSADAQRHLRELGAARTGVRVHAPFLDDQVVRACLAVPAPERADPAAAKPLLAEAMRGLVPGDIFSRRTKGDYSAEEYHGARASAGRLHRLIDESRLAALGVVEPGPVRAGLDRVLVGAPAPLGAMSQFMATERWLRDHRRGTC
ncbi:asparagine synthase-related protein [Nonomuraea diastatica]|uniref:asparagine synthase-related protein n=1 Tax=Nonomuraea diastatica TaxID=1848329 RepID=UPI00140B6B5E|nr:asparagine synthase-related protein [Nonomuraea diastatica]